MTEISPTTPPRRFPTFRLTVAVIVVVGLFWLIGYVAAIDGGSDLVVKDQLAQKGALVVMATDGRHVASVSLSTIKDASQVREALQIASGLKQPGSLDLSRTEITNDDMPTIGSMASLTSLSLKRTQIDDQGVAHLAALGQLESLHLNNTAVSNAGLQHIAALRELKVLDLSNTQVTGDLQTIAKLPDLEWLVLSNLSLTEGALTALADSPSLRRLSLRGSEYSDGALDELRRRRPEISIDE